MKKNKVYTYHKTCSFESDAMKVSLITQQYKTGIYIIINDDPNLQFNYEPKDMVKLEKSINKTFKSGKITNLVYGSEVKVHMINGLWEEIK